LLDLDDRDTLESARYRLNQMAKISETMRKKENNKRMEMKNKRGRDKVNVG
jgi:hypothetical protein